MWLNSARSWNSAYSDVRLQREQLPRQLQHVVDVAGLGGAAVGDVGQLVGLAEVLVLAVAAGRERVVVDDAIPEERRGDAVGRDRRCTTYRAGDADQLRDLRVAVQAVERVFVDASADRARPVFEVVRQLEPAPVAGVGVQIGQHLVHAAELGGQHALQSASSSSARENALRPRRRT